MRDLRSPELELQVSQVLKAIDNSAEESEKKGEESALENALKNSDFRKFAEDVLDTITTGKEERERE